LIDQYKTKYICLHSICNKSLKRGQWRDGGQYWKCRPRVWV